MAAPVVSVVARGGDKCGAYGLRLIILIGEVSKAVSGLNGEATMATSFASKKGL